MFGQLNINPKVIQQDFRTLIDTFLHETYHIMGFSPELFEYFVDDNLIPINISETVVFDQQGKITGIKSPTVLKVAREHFDCSYIRSVNFENEGLNGGAGSHWERNIMMNEIMTATNISSSRVSIFTLALMQDSGWYEVDIGFSEHFTHWKNVGCKLNFDLDVKSILVNHGNLSHLSWMEDECNQMMEKGCFYDRTHQALCLKDDFLGNNNDQRFENLQSNKFRYFSIPTDSCTHQGIQKNYEIFGEAYGSDQRCFVGSLTRSGDYLRRNVNFSSNGTFCFTSRCQHEATAQGRWHIEIEFKKKKFICREAGQQLQINIAESPEEGGFQIRGTIECPNPSEFCLHEPKCRENCETEGRCLANGSCYKFD